MTVAPSIDPARFLEEHLAQASPDLLRSMLSSFISTLLSADADAVCGAAYGTVSDDRVNRRNGYRHRDFDTRAGTIDIAIPKLRTGTYFPEWLLERRRRAEQAMISVVATSYLLGVSTRRMEGLVAQLGITSLSKSQVSEMAKDLDVHVAEFRTRPLDAGPYRFVAADALTMKVREGGRVVRVAVMVVTGVNNDGYREVLGLRRRRDLPQPRLDHPPRRRRPRRTARRMGRTAPLLQPRTPHQDRHDDPHRQPGGEPRPPHQRLTLKRFRFGGQLVGGFPV